MAAGRLALVLAIALGAMFPLACSAQETSSRSDTRIGVGTDVVHRRYTAMGAVKYGPLTAYVWERNLGLGATFEMGRKVGWNAGVGAILVAKVDDTVGTHLNFLLRASYCLTKVCLSAAHISHGTDLGILPNRENDGFNFVYLEYRL